MPLPYYEVARFGSIANRFIEAKKRSLPEAKGERQSKPSRAEKARSLAH
jgi:hypothetical protein